MHRFNYDSNFHSLYQSSMDPRHAQQMSHHYQQQQASSSAMVPNNPQYPSSSTTVPQTVNNGQAVQIAPDQNSATAAEDGIIDVEQFEPTPVLTNQVEQPTGQTRDRLNKDAYRDQFKLATFTCKFANAHGQQCGKTFPIVLSYLSRYQETSLFRENFDSISQDFK